MGPPLDTISPYHVGLFHRDKRSAQAQAEHGPSFCQSPRERAHCTHSFQKQDTDQHQEERRQEDERVLEHDHQPVALKSKPFHDGGTSRTIHTTSMLPQEFLALGNSRVFCGRDGASRPVVQPGVRSRRSAGVDEGNQTYRRQIVCSCSGDQNLSRDRHVLHRQSEEASRIGCHAGMLALRRGSRTLKRQRTVGAVFSHGLPMAMSVAQPDTAY